MNDCDILVLEDEALIAMDIEMTLEEAGHDNIVVCHTADEAMLLIDRCKPKMALLDFNLGQGANSELVARRLKADNVPFVFLSGYTESRVAILDELATTKRIAKPFQNHELLSKVSCILQA